MSPRTPLSVIVAALSLWLGAASLHAQPKAGDAVLVRRLACEAKSAECPFGRRWEFLAAEVASVKGDRAKVKFTREDLKGEGHEALFADVSPLPSGDRPTAASGDLVIGNTGFHWSLVRVRSLNESGVLVASLEDGTEETLAFDAVKALPAGWKADVDTQAARTLELAAIRCTRAPLGAGKPLANGTAVLAESGKDLWSEGTVKAATGTKYKIAFADEAADVDASRVAPLPTPGQTFPVKVKDVVFWKLSGLPGSWTAGRVDGITGGALALTLGTGEEVTADPGEYLPQAAP
jgi:hypothetical protein